MTQLKVNAELAPCSVAIKCADDPLIARCLDSIDDQSVSVNAVITPSARIEVLLKDRGIPYVITDYGNIAKSAQLSVDTAEHDNVIVMDSDAYFTCGAIHKLRTALVESPIAKPRLEFKQDGTHISRLIAESRRQFNAIPHFATNPGLALRRAEITERCGYVFNPRIRWTEDADLNFRMLLNDVPLRYVKDAVIFHDPVTLSHELWCAYRYGIGKRLSVEHTPTRVAEEDIKAIAQNILTGQTFKKFRHNVAHKDIDGVALAAIWRIIYLTGYHAQKYSGKWTTPNYTT